MRGYYMNAIILAAGIGLRMREISQNGHKALLPIGDKSIIERTICHLLEAGIDDITIVTGHRKELFEPLKEQYGVTLLYNRKYSLNNNLRSLEMVLDKIGDTFVIHGDVVLYKNIFNKEEDHTFFYTILKESKGVPVLHPVVNKRRIMQRIETYAGGDTVTSLLGVCFWAKQDVHYLKEFYETQISDKMKRKFLCEWESIVLELLHSFPIEGRQIDRKYARDINIMMDYYDAYCTFDQFWDKRNNGTGNKITKK